MNRDPRQIGMTLIDVLIIIVTIGLAAVLILQPISRSRSRSPRITCMNNLHKVGLAYLTWAGDHGEQFPWSVRGTNGGTLEQVTSDVAPQFSVVSNHLDSAKSLMCPADRMRVRAVQWDARFSRTNISYFVGLDADETKPTTILSGDRTFSTNAVVLSGMLIVQKPTQVQWASGIHGAAGNIGMGDGSAQQMSQSQLANHFATNMTLPARFILP